jgi:hypothetical protein
MDNRNIAVRFHIRTGTFPSSPMTRQDLRHNQPPSLRILGYSGRDVKLITYFQLVLKFEMHLHLHSPINLHVMELN